VTTPIISLNHPPNVACFNCANSSVSGSQLNSKLPYAPQDIKWSFVFDGSSCSIESHHCRQTQLMIQSSRVWVLLGFETFSDFNSGLLGFVGAWLNQGLHLYSGPRKSCFMETEAAGLRLSFHAKHCSYVIVTVSLFILSNLWLDDILSYRTVVSYLVPLICRSVWTTASCCACCIPWCH